MLINRVRRTFANCLCRQLQACIEILLQNDVTTVQKLAHVKFEDLVFEPNTTAGKKATIRAALKSVAHSRKENTATSSSGVNGSTNLSRKPCTVLHRAQVWATRYKKHLRKF